MLGILIYYSQGILIDLYDKISGEYIASLEYKNILAIGVYLSLNEVRIVKVKYSTYSQPARQADYIIELSTIVLECR